MKIPHYDGIRVLIVGDVMLDRYWYGQTSRISPEAPVPVVHVQKQEERPGGAGNVALNIAALGGTVDLISISGQDEAANSLLNQLTAAGINCHFQQLANIPTITKLRVLSHHQQLIRLDFEESHLHFNQARLLESFQDCLAYANIVILSDYAKGSLTCAPELIQLARQQHIPVLVDPKTNNFDLYRGATLITPNLKEFEAVVGPCPDDETIANLGLQLIRQHQLEALLITRSEHGMTLLQAQHPPLHLHAREREVFDVTGAGDTVIATLAASLASGENFTDATILANIAAGIVVGKLGAAVVTPAELHRAIWTDHYPINRGILTEAELIVALQDAKAHGEKIVMTNGCFDILHAGHIHYLKQAKAQGDRLIVAVNDDASVARLKGAKRPINSLAERMAVLAGLAAVDWVVPFSEDTPERLISHLLPDILVKGGDYQIADIAGAKAVIAHGGEVKVLDFVAGCSTTQVITKIQNSGELI